MPQGGKWDWHNDEDVNTAVREFHDKCARQPDMDKAKKDLEQVLEKIYDYMKSNGICNRFEYTGSSYDGTKIPDGLEFDVIVVMTCSGLDVEENENKPGEYTIKVTGEEDNPVLQRALTAGMNRQSNSILYGDLTYNKFFGGIHRALNAAGLQGRAVLRRHGSGVQMDMKRTFGSDIWYSVDMVPTLEYDEELFVTRGTGWVLSYALKEKKHLRTIDANNTCKRECIRVLKALKTRHAFPGTKTNYFLKAALFHEEDESDDWERSHIGFCVIRLLIRLRDDFRAKHLENPYIPGVNVLMGLKKTVFNGVPQRLDNLLNKKKQFLKILRH